MSDIFTTEQRQAAQALSNASVKELLSQIKLKDAPLLIQQVGDARLTLSQNGKPLQLPIQQIQGQLLKGEKYLANLKQDAQGTFLEFVQPGQQKQSLQLNQAQSQQLLNNLFASGDVTKTLANVKVSAKVLDVKNDQLLLQINGQRVRLQVNGAAQNFTKGQVIQLSLSNVTAAKNLAINIQQPETGKKHTLHLPVKNDVVRSIVEAVIAKQPVNPNSSDKNILLAIQKTLPQNQLLSFRQASPESISIKGLGEHKLQVNWSVKESVIAKLPIDKQQLPAIHKWAQEQPIKTESPSKEATSRVVEKEINTGTRTETSAKSVATEVPVASKQITNQIESILRQSQAKADSPSISVKQIENVLQNLSADKQSALATLVTQLKAQTTLNPESNELQLPQQIKQIIQAPALPISTSQLTAPAPPTSFVAGLVSMLQVSLAARLVRNQPAQLDKIMQALTPILVQGQQPVPTKQQASKSLNDLFQADQRHQLLKGLASLSANHQQSKLAAAEAQLQAQDSLYYVLPIGQNEQRKDVELLIKRERDKPEEDGKKVSKGTYWSLTMKLDIGDIGQLLAKARLQEKHLDVDFYTSNDKTKDLVLNFLPFLRKRFSELGIEMGKGLCQLGKIPETLQSRPYHLFEAKA